MNTSNTNPYNIVIILHDTFGQVIGQLVNEDENTITLNKPCNIQFSNKSVSYTELLGVVQELTLKISKSKFDNSLLTPVKELSDQYASQFISKIKIQ